MTAVIRMVVDNKSNKEAIDVKKKETEEENLEEVFK